MARMYIAAALRHGRVVRPSLCDECGSEGMIEAHHDDYWKPLDVKWLCPPCHHSKPRGPIGLGSGGKRVSPGEPTETFAVRIPESMADRVDAIRGPISRSEWIRSLILERLVGGICPDHGEVKQDAD